MQVWSPLAHLLKQVKMAAQVVLLKQPLISLLQALTRHLVVGSQSTAHVLAVSVDWQVPSPQVLGTLLQSAGQLLAVSLPLHTPSPQEVVGVVELHCAAQLLKPMKRLCAWLVPLATQALAQVLSEAPQACRQVTMAMQAVFA